MNRVPLRSLRSLRLTTALTAVATRPTTRRCRSGRPTDAAPSPDHAPARLAEPPSKPPRASPSASPGPSRRASPAQRQPPEPLPASPRASPRARPRAPSRRPVRRDHGRPRAAGRRVAAARPPAAAGGAGSRPRRWCSCSPRWPRGCATSRCASSLAGPTSHRTAAAGRRPLVGGHGHRRGHGRLRGLALAERTQQVIALGDPATYLQTASWITRHGSLPIPYSPEAFGGTHPGLTFASASYYPSGSGLAPAVMAGTPLVLAAAIWLGGDPGGAGHHAADRRVRGAVVRRPGAGWSGPGGRPPRPPPSR